MDGGVYAATQGPRLETIAEINRFERDGAAPAKVAFNAKKVLLDQELELKRKLLAIERRQRLVLHYPQAGKDVGPPARLDAQDVRQVGAGGAVVQACAPVHANAPLGLQPGEHRLDIRGEVQRDRKSVV